MGLLSLGTSILGYGIERIEDSSTNGLERFIKSEYQVVMATCAVMIGACWAGTGIVCFWSWLISPAPCAAAVAKCTKMTFTWSGCFTGWPDVEATIPERSPTNRAIITKRISDVVNGHARYGKSSPFRKFYIK